MDLLKIFQKHDKEQKTNTSKLAGTGFIPSFGKQPSIPAIPKIEPPQNLPRISGPSPEAAKASKEILNPDSKKS